MKCYIPLLLAGAAAALPMPDYFRTAIEARAPQVGPGGWSGWNNHHDEPDIIAPIDIDTDERTQIIASTVEKRGRAPVVITPVDIEHDQTTQVIGSSVEKRDNFAPVDVKQIDCSQTVNSIVN